MRVKTAKDIFQRTVPFRPSYSRAQRTAVRISAAISAPALPTGVAPAVCARAVGSFPFDRLRAVPA